MQQPVTVAKMAPKNSTEPITIQNPPISRLVPINGVSAVPAVENAATPRYNASPRAWILVPGRPRYARYRPAANSSHRTIGSSTRLTNGVWVTTSRGKRPMRAGGAPFLNI